MTFAYDYLYVESQTKKSFKFKKRLEDIYELNRKMIYF